MFTGIIAAVGQVSAVELQAGEGSFRFATAQLSLAGVGLGDSIACNGMCLTVTKLHTDGFSADLSRETLACTTAGDWQPGTRVNFERALALGDALGGHLVTGHVDGVGVVSAMESDGESLRLSIDAPDEFARFIAQKGSICVDGVSLTVNSVAGRNFGVMIVPHTQKETIIASYASGTRVNLEVDMIARYLERIVQYTDRPENV